MAQDWYTPETAAPMASPPLPASAFELRPLSLGEILDRTFAVYRSRFWLFAGIAVISGAIELLTNLANLLVHHIVLVKWGVRTATTVNSLASFPVLAVTLLATSVTQAATVYALSEIYLGHETTVIEALKATIGRWLRYVGIAFWMGWSAVWVGMLLVIPAFLLIATRVPALTVVGGLLMIVGVLGGSVYGAIAYLRNSLGIQAAVIEGSGVRASMRRSKVLTSGAKGRIFVVLLIVFAMLMVVTTVQAPLIFVVLKSPLQEHTVAQIVSLLIQFVAHTVVSPVGLIGLSLVYFDQRVRKEAFDVLMLLGPEVPAPVPAPVPEPVLYAEPALDPADPMGSDGRF